MSRAAFDGTRIAASWLLYPHSLNAPLLIIRRIEFIVGQKSAMRPFICSSIPAIKWPAVSEITILILELGEWELMINGIAYAEER